MQDSDFYVSGTSAHALLKDGTLCRIRPLGPDDRPFLIACFERLSADSRRLRFLGAKPALTKQDLAFLTDIDGCQHIALGAERLDPRGEVCEPLGVARCIRLTPGSDTGEIAIAVIDVAQGHGLGTHLLTHLAQAAHAQGIRRFRCEVLAENTGMRALAAGLGGAVRWLGDGMLEYDCPLPAPIEEPDQTPVWSAPLATGRMVLDVWSMGADSLLRTALDLRQTFVGAWCEHLSNDWWDVSSRFERWRCSNPCFTWLHEFCGCGT